MAVLYRRLLRLNVVTGSPLVLSRAPTRPIPCGYLLFTTVQFFQRAGMRAFAAPADGAPSTKTIAAEASIALAWLE
jgi:hypothetical protein